MNRNSKVLRKILLVISIVNVLVFLIASLAQIIVVFSEEPIIAIQFVIPIIMVLTISFLSIKTNNIIMIIIGMFFAIKYSFIYSLIYFMILLIEKIANSKEVFENSDLIIEDKLYIKNRIRQRNRKI